MITDEAGPLAYGYVRVTGPADRERLMRFRSQMSAYAQERGFTLGDVFVDLSTSRESGFGRLVARLKQGDATEVLVPALEHFTRFPSLQAGVVTQIEALGVTVWEVGR
ncbi:recombinase family protein [Nocardiopsis valliformis]|uniref:recombinase family protein n=1 Tax=Nocardiopsis valliformis TaxID=239974 RepID=UPI00034CE5C0|nr:recombinase family protein [Nocardiopsis valliformis]